MPRFPRPRLSPLALAVGALLLCQLSTSAQAQCSYETGHSGQVSFEMDMGPLWMPRDAPDGQVIATASPTLLSPTQLVCNYSSVRETRAQLINTAPLVTHLAPMRGNRNTRLPIMQTKIAGIGVSIELGAPYDGALVTTSNRFTADPGTLTAIPFVGGMRDTTAFPAQMYVMRPTLTLIKTGPIAPGPQVIDEEMFHGIIDTLGKVLDFRLRATLHHAQCTLQADAVSADPVNLGDHFVGDFTGPGSTSGNVAFHIRLNDCYDDSNGSVATAHVRLDGIRGSSSLDRSLGLFSLTSNSTARGIGIQMLRADGTSMPLEEEVPVRRLSVGITRLNFQARYYQTAAKLTPGLAEGALNFTITYK